MYSFRTLFRQICNQGCYSAPQFLNFGWFLRLLKEPVISKLRENTSIMYHGASSALSSRGPKSFGGRREHTCISYTFLYQLANIVSHFEYSLLLSQKRPPEASFFHFLNSWSRERIFLDRGPRTRSCLLLDLLALSLKIMRLTRILELVLSYFY